MANLIPNLFSDDGEDKIRRIKIPEVLLLGIITLMGYGLLFSCYSGYLDFFNIPYDFMTFDIPFILTLLAIILIFGFVIYPFVGLFYLFASEFKSKRIKVYFLSQVIFFGFFIAIILIKFIRIGNLYYLAFSMFLLLPFIKWFLTPIFDKSRDGYKIKFEKQFINYLDGPENENSFYKIIFSPIGNYRISLLLLYIMLFILLSLMGDLNAFEKRSFFVVKTNPQCAIIYSSSDKVVCKTFDYLTKEFNPDYMVYYYSDLKGVDIVSENIGPLKPKPTSNPTFIPTITPILPTPTVLHSLTPTPFE